MSLVRLRVASVQLAGIDESNAWDMSPALNAVVDAARQGARLIVLPELATTPYFCVGEPPSYARWAKPVDCPEIRQMMELAGELDVVVVLPFFELDEESGTRHNAAVVLDRRGIVACVSAGGSRHQTTRKLHLPRSVGSDEADHFVAGEWIGVHHTAVGTVGVLICYDRRFPECWRMMRALGADVVAVVVAGAGADPAGFFLAELRTHAQENGVYAVAASKVGADTVAGRTVPHDGGSSVHAPDGRITAVRHADAGPGLVTGWLELSELPHVRRTITLFDERRLGLVGDSVVASGA